MFLRSLLSMARTFPHEVVKDVEDSSQHLFSAGLLSNRFQMNILSAVGFPSCLVFLLPDFPVATSGNINIFRCVSWTVDLGVI